uniref:Uncharacterized protein n=1 Tax=Auxenochlorella protothecoides TaxID=3075 RepID=A0A1D2AHX1_AUXPR
MEGLRTLLGSIAVGPAVGLVLRRTSLLEDQDVQVALRFVSQITLPSLILHTLGGPLPPYPWVPTLSLYLGTKAIIAVLAFATHAHQPLRQRFASVALCLPTGPVLLAIPLLGLLAGPPALAVGLTLAALDAVLLRTLGFAALSRAGNALPEALYHDDGGKYRGELSGALKDGFGVYRYASGAQYQGEWRDNVKSGRGIYRYKSGAAYAGEWQAGVPEGRGIRTSASGKAQSGIWKGGKLSQRTEPEECALAVATAAQAASAAKKVEVGGFSPGAALRSLLSTPALLAVGVVGAFWLAGKPLSPSVVSAAGRLATFQAPLALIVLGLTLGDGGVKRGARAPAPAQARAG